MGVVDLRRSGFIFQDTFDLTSLDPRWEMSPSDSARWSISEVPGALRLKHGASPIYAFLNELTAIKQFVLDVKNVYNPTTEDDVGGLIVYGSDTDYIMLDEYYDVAEGTAQTYNWVRLIRNYNTYYAYWSDDGLTWTALGSQEFDNVSPRIGIFLSGTAGENLDIEEIRVMAGTKLTLENISPGQKVELLDPDGTVLDTLYGRDGFTEVRFDVSNYGMPLHSRFVVDGTIGSSDSTLYQMWGGDSYAVNYAVDLSYIDDAGVHKSLRDNFEEFLGYLIMGAGGTREIQMIAKNSFTSGTFTSINATLADYQGTGQYTSMVSLAEDSGGVPGTPQSSIPIPDITAGAEKIFWLILKRETDPARLSSNVFFSLNVTATFN